VNGVLNTPEKGKVPDTATVVIVSYLAVIPLPETLHTVHECKIISGQNLCSKNEYRSYSTPNDMLGCQWQVVVSHFSVTSRCLLSLSKFVQTVSFWKRKLHQKFQIMEVSGKAP
jgi:hypothetical protein